MIKYRAWCKTTEDMYSWKRLVHQERWWEDKDYILMQYIGLRDKNGKEIYEGDILRVSFGRHRITIGTHEITMNIEHGLRTMWGTDTMTKSYANIGEVIGNRYENPNQKSQTGSREV